ATNVGRVLGRRWGWLCFALDVAKGFAPALAVSCLTGCDADGPTTLQQTAWLVVGAGAILGHVLSFWLGFRGGKGVATG
ncbi:MAG TPA: acyl-phosphate glycerol 3-phosphate acyltransferase, partial [Phycisphaerales bacterium]|nr:acyl-phosphate glycerol 3-phosphate acyltransferase [Phycisphaerales bacterium]